jgi:hypothetical protein
MQMKDRGSDLELLNKVKTSNSQILIRGSIVANYEPPIKKSFNTTVIRAPDQMLNQFSQIHITKVSLFKHIL